MTQQRTETTDRACEDRTDEEVNLLDYWRVIRKRWKSIAGIVFATVITTIAVSLFMPDIYQAKAVIMPVVSRDSGSGNVGLTALAQQFGGLPGITMPGSTSAAEIVSLLRSNILREKIIHQYKLMPVLFSERWDADRQAWKKGGQTGSRLNPLTYIPSLRKAFEPTTPREKLKDPDIPDTWDALRLLNEMVKINQDSKQNTIAITVDFPDPGTAARIVEYFIVTLTNYMSSEAKRVAATNRKYLEEQLGSTADPIIKQKTYNMIAQQIEAGMMAEVKENFAFKIIDPPLTPDRLIKPKRAQMVMLLFFAALVAGIFMAFFLEYLSKIRAGK